MTGKLNAGTHPQRNRRGVNYGGNIVVGTEAAGFIFVNPAAGTVPERNTVFHSRMTQIDAETALNVFGYRNIPAGKINAGEAPQRSHRGGSAGAAVEAQGETEAHVFTSTAAGTVPDRSTVQRTEGGAVENTVQAAGFSFSVKQCGSSRKL